jgi:hypothetical protein
MHATVIEVKDDEVYLQIGNELRFRAHFIAPFSSQTICQSALIDFDFDPRVNPAVIIRKVERQLIGRFSSR